MATDVARTRQAVLGTTLELIAAGGVGAVTIARVAADSGVSNGSIYHHFGSREGVLRHLLLDCFGQLATALQPALDDRAAEVCIRDLVRRHLRWVAAEPGPAAVVYSVPLDEAVTGDGTVAAEKRPAIAPLLDWFAERTARGELRAIPSWALDPIVLGPVHEVARRRLGAGTAHRTQVEAVVADAVWAVVAPPNVQR